MSAILTQSNTAAFPDRPRITTDDSPPFGLRVEIGDDENGAFLAHALDTNADALHTRVMLAPNGYAQGHVVFLTTLDSDDARIAQIAYHATDRTVRLTLNPSASAPTILTATLPSAFAWHAIEFMTNANQGTAELRVNGQSIQQADSLTLDATASLQLGALGKGASDTGEIHLDEWIIADEPIGAGPPTIASSSALPPTYPDDPATWLVVYNTNSPDSTTWASHYRQARNIPYANLCGLPLSLNETIDVDAFAAMSQGIDAYLADNNLADRVLGILFGYDVPGYAEQHLPSLFFNPVPALRHSSSLGGSNTANPIYNAQTPVRPTHDNLAGLRLTARIDAPTLSDAIAITDRALAFESISLDSDKATIDRATLFFDPHITANAINPPLVKNLVAWGNSFERAQTRIPFAVTQPTDTLTNPNFTTIQNDAFYWGWSAATPPANLFTEPAGHRLFAIDLYESEPTAPTLRNPATGRWAGAALLAGYNAFAGTSKPYSLSAQPNPRPFFEALKNGWTLAEAYFASLPRLRTGMFLVGDPLAKIALPRAGWDLYGPTESLESIDLTAPQLLPSHPTKFTTDPPNTSKPNYVYLRRVDHLGRQTASDSFIRFLASDSDADPTPVTLPVPLLAPAWPDENTWSPATDNGKLQIVAQWERPLGLAGIVRAELWQQPIDTPGSESLVTLENPITIDPLKRSIQSAITPPPSATRYRWRFFGDDEQSIVSPWSRAVEPAVTTHRDPFIFTPARSA